MCNFKCNKCNKEFMIVSFTTVIRNDACVYFTNKNMNVRIVCDNLKCKRNPLDYVDKVLSDEGEITAPFIMKIAGMDSNQRTEYFNKRARDNYKKHGRDEKMEKLKQYGAR